MPTSNQEAASADGENVDSGRFEPTAELSGVAEIVDEQVAIPRVPSELEQSRQHAANLEAKVAGLEFTIEHLAKRIGRLVYEVAAQKQEISRLEANTARTFQWFVKIGLALRRLKLKIRGRHVSQAMEVPSDFDEAYYLIRYPDVGRAKMTPYEHYVRHGKAEGRLGRSIAFKVQIDEHRIDGQKPYVLVVSHEATRTGAPILALNICQQLERDYNVVGLLLGSGELVAYFKKACVATVGPYQPGEVDQTSAKEIIAAALRKFPLKFAVVNSLASRMVLPSLAENGVASIFLVHEFYNFQCRDEELADALSWAGRIVFPGEIVRQSASIDRTSAAIALAHIIPQGKCLIPANGDSPAADATVRQLKKLIENRSARPLVVLGAGVVEYRKGVDLFVSTASEIHRSNPSANILMVWVGKIAPAHRQYADFVEQQVKQAGIAAGFALLPETSQIEEVYAMADVCFLPSRLDPLPNIAIDAMTAGLPVLCFERASAVAEILSQNGLTRDCVLPFLNVEEAAKQLIKLWREPQHRKTVADSCRMRAKKTFDLRTYVDQLIELADEEVAYASQLRTEVNRLVATNDFMTDFYKLPGTQLGRAEEIRRFCVRSKNRIFDRKPQPGFFGNLYVASHPKLPRFANPYLHYLDQGRPTGEWQLPMLNLADDANEDFSSHLRIAVHIHIFDPELVQGMLDRLHASNAKYDLFVSVPSAECAEKVTELFRTGPQNKLVVKVVPNRGRDVGPLLTQFADDLVGYDVIGHFHAKNSGHLADTQLAQDWDYFLLESLLGGRFSSMDRILGEFAKNPRLGLVFADDPNMIGWSKNFVFAQEIADRIGLKPLPSLAFPFPVGGMFWARPAALKPLFDLKYAWDDYPEEPLPADGTMLHALECLIAIVAAHVGYEVNATWAPGLAR